MKATLWIVLSLLVVASLVFSTACTPTPAATPVPTTGATVNPTAPPPADTPVPPPPGEPVKITVFVGFGTGTDPSQIELHNQLAAEFNAAHPNIQVEFITTSYDEHDAKFTTMLAGGTPPDLVMPIGVMGIATYYDEWLDVTPYIERDGYDMSDYYGPAVQLQTYADKVVGLPIGVYPSVTYYNEDLFDQAELEYPPHAWGEPDWTYAKLVEVAQKLTLDENGNDATSPDFNPDKIAQWGWDGWDWSPWRIVPGKFGGNPLGMSADFKTAEMNGPAWQESMQFLSDTIWTWHIRPTGEVATSAFSDIDPMQSGQVAMWEVFSWMAYNYSTWTEGFNWNVAAIPAGPHGDIVAEANGDTFAIPRSSKHPDEAWEVAKWFMEPEVLAQLAQSYGCIPARKSLAAGWIDQMKADYPKVDWQVFIDSIDYMDAQPNNESWVPAYKKTWDAMENSMSLVVTGENTDVQAILDALNVEVQGYLDEYWATR